MPKIDAKKLILYLLYLPSETGQKCEPIEGITRMQKMIFLYEKEILPVINKCGQLDYTSPNFIAYKFGPYSNDVFDSLRFFISTEFIQEKSTNREKPIADITQEIEYDYDDYDDRIELTTKDLTKFDGVTSIFELTKKGQRFVENSIMGLFTSDQRDVLISFKKRINSLPLNAILQYVYKNYEDMTVNSIIKDKVIK